MERVRNQGKDWPLDCIVVVHCNVLSSLCNVEQSAVDELYPVVVRVTVSSLDWQLYELHVASEFQPEREREIININGFSIHILAHVSTFSEVPSLAATMAA